MLFSDFVYELLPYYFTYSYNLAAANNIADVICPVIGSEDNNRQRFKESWNMFRWKDTT